MNIPRDKNGAVDWEAVNRMMTTSLSTEGAATKTYKAFYNAAIDDAAALAENHLGHELTEQVRELKQ